MFFTSKKHSDVEGCIKGARAFRGGRQQGAALQSTGRRRRKHLKRARSRVHEIDRGRGRHATTDNRQPATNGSQIAQKTARKTPKEGGGRGAQRHRIGKSSRRGGEKHPGKGETKGERRSAENEGGLGRTGGRTPAQETRSAKCTCGARCELKMLGGKMLSEVDAVHPVRGAFLEDSWKVGMEF